MTENQKTILNDPDSLAGHFFHCLDILERKFPTLCTGQNAMTYAAMTHERLNPQQSVKRGAKLWGISEKTLRNYWETLKTDADKSLE